MTVGDLMTAFPESLTENDTIKKAAQMMRDHDYGMMPILDSNEALIGVVTDRDIVVKAIAEGRDSDTSLSECMTRQPDTITKDLLVQDALHLMNTRQIRRVPVVEFGRLIGMLSLADIARSEVPAAEKTKTLESVSAGGSDIRPGADLPEN